MEAPVTQDMIKEMPTATRSLYIRYNCSIPLMKSDINSNLVPHKLNKKYYNLYLLSIYFSLKQMQAQSYWRTDPYCVLQDYHSEIPPYDPSILPKVNKFVEQLECPHTKALGINKYWDRLAKITFSCGQPALMLRTFDGYRITFICAKSMVKLSGLAHTLQNQETNQKSQCSECLYKVSKLFREVILPGFGLPQNSLSEDKELKQAYESYVKD